MKGKSILIIEDNTGDYTLIVDYFEEFAPDVEIIRAITFEEAKELMTAPMSFSCILLDLTLPDHSGVELVKDIMAISSNIPVIVLTGYSNSKFGIQAVSLGVSDYILKDELSASILEKTIRYSIERNNINEKIRLSEQKYKNLFLNSPKPLWVFDTATFKFLDVNKSAIRHYGYSRNEFLNMTLRDIRLPEDIHFVENVVQRTAGKEIYFHGVFRHLKKNGEIIFVEVQSNQFDFDGKSGRLVQINDITEQLKTQKALFESESRFKSLVQEGSDLVSIMDENGVFTYISPNSESSIGYPLNSFLGKSPFDFIHPDDIERIKSSMEKINNEKKIVIKPYRFLAADGSWVWFESTLTNLIQDPAILGIVSNNRNVTERYQYEEKLRKQSAQFKVLIEKSPTMKTLISPEGKILFGTPSITKILGYSPEEFTGQFETDFVHPEDVERLNSSIQKIQNNEELVQPIELRIKHKNGHYIWCEKIITNMLDDIDIKAIVCNFWDITAIKTANIKIQESNERYDRVADATSDVIWDLDLKTNNIVWNKGMEKLFGYASIDENNALEFWKSIIHPDDRERVELRFYENLKYQYVTWEDEYRVLCFNGNYKYVFDRGYLVKNEQGESVRMVGAIQDITRQKEEESRLRLLESVITNTSDSILITDAEPIDGIGPQIIYVNEAFTKMTGYTSEEVIGKTPRFLQSENSSREKLDELKQSLQKWQPCELEIINKRKNGEEYWVNMAIAPVADSRGWFTHWIAIERDVTERKKAEHDKELLIQELTKNNNDLKQFSYITSHNLRAPLSNLIGILNLMEDFEFKDPQIEKLIKGFQTSTNQLNETINDLIKILIIKDNPSMERQVLLFDDVVNKVIDQLKMKIDLIQPEIRIDFSHAPSVSFNQTYLESIIQNLVTNSLRYRSEERPLKISISTENVKNGIRLFYSDNGIGFDLLRFKDRVFGLYQRFHKHPDGKGLGLYLVKSQLEALGGSIEVESAINNGTRFELTFH